MSDRPCVPVPSPRVPRDKVNPLLGRRIHRWGLLSSVALVGCAEGSGSYFDNRAGGSAMAGASGASGLGAGGSGTGNSGASGGAGQGGGGDEVVLSPLPSWNWTGVIGTGQSLSVGEQAAVLSATTQPFQNLKLSLGSVVVPPFDAEAAGLSMVPLVETIRGSRAPCTYPCAYPRNIYGETPHTAMANQISSMMSADYVTVHSVVGENGQGMPMLRKGAAEVVVGETSTGRAFEATLFEARAITRLATAEGKTYGMGAIVITHGESDAGNANYEADLLQLWSDYNQDIAAITGQTATFPMLVSQQHSVPFTMGATSPASASTLAQWRVGRNNPGDVICSGPKYQYPYAADGVHMNTLGYDKLGEKYGEVYYERVVLGRNWQPLGPVSVARNGARGITVTLHVPVPPLVWDEEMMPPHQAALTEWANGRGFEVQSGGTRVAIESVNIDGDSVQITTMADLPATTLTVGYAITSDGALRPQGTSRWGLLRDSDAVVGAVTGTPQPNYAVAFQETLP